MKYEKQARYYPVLVTMLPLCFACSYVGVYYCGNEWNELQKILAVFLGFVPLTLLTSVVVWFLKDLFRWTSKLLVQSIIFGGDGTSFPTTTMLLNSSRDLSEQHKRQIAKKVDQRFQIKLLTREEEQNNPKEARRTIRDAVDRMRQVTRDNRDLLACNIEYGKARNALGGCLYALVILSGLWYYFRPDSLLLILLGLEVLQSVAWFVSLIARAKEYARTLFVAFLNQDAD